MLHSPSLVSVTVLPVTEQAPDATMDTAIEEDAGQSVQVLTVKRAADSVLAEPPARPEERTVGGVTRWGATSRDHIEPWRGGDRETIAPQLAPAYSGRIAPGAEYSVVRQS